MLAARVVFHTLAIVLTLGSFSIVAPAAEPDSAQGHVPLVVDLDALRSRVGLSISDLDVQKEKFSPDAKRTVSLRHYSFRFFSQRFLD